MGPAWYELGSAGLDVPGSWIVALLLLVVLALALLAAAGCARRLRGENISGAPDAAGCTLCAPGTLCRGCRKPSSRGVEEVEWADLGPEGLYERFIAAGRPVLLRGAARDWPARAKWTPKFLAGQLGRERSVLVSRSVEESSAPTAKEAVQVGELAELMADASAAGGRPPPLSYMKQCDIFALCPSLADDIHAAELLRAGGRGRCVPFLTHFCWMGPAGSVTGLHNDDEDNVLAQILGTKRVLLLEPQEREFLYVNGKYDSGTECCDVNPVEPDLLRHPLYAQARPPIVATLHAGDVLFIPVRHAAARH